jgi:hypothetical protein
MLPTVPADLLAGVTGYLPWRFACLLLIRQTILDREALCEAS